MKGRIEMPISEPTAVFSIRDDRDMEIKQAVLQVRFVDAAQPVETESLEDI